MRKIIHHLAYHNIARAALTTLLLSILLLGAAGCGQKADTDAASGQAATTSTHADCGLVVNAKPWVAFLDMANRMAAGQEVPRAELEAYGQMPAVDAWRRSLTPNVPRVAALANWLEGAWWEKLGRTGKHKVVADGRSMGRSFLYSHQHQTQIDELIAAFNSDEYACRVRDLNALWISPDNISSPLVLNILPTMAEVRIFENEIFIDTGVLQAGSKEQTVRLITSLLYRNLEAVPGKPPLESTGEQAIAECLRVMMNEGMAALIEQTLNLEFDPRHHTLHKIQMVPEDYYRKAQYTLGLFAEQLPVMFADDAVMAARGGTFARTLAAGSSFTQTGLAMASVIKARLGLDRLRQVRSSVPDFLAAYQEAALLNNTPCPEPGTTGTKLYETVPPLDPALFSSLHAMLQRHFTTP